MRTSLIMLTFVAGALTTACAGSDGGASSETEEALVERARGIHERAITIDTHVDINPNNFLAGQANYTTGLGTQVDLPKMEQGGLDAAFFSI